MPAGPWACPPPTPAGVDPREYSRQYEAKLRQAEVASVQDYIAESDSLAELHSQARLAGWLAGG